MAAQQTRAWCKVDTTGHQMVLCSFPATVAWHMRNIYDKLQVHSKSDAVAKALRSGLIR